jgi:3-dehydroquinate synthase
VRRVTRIEVALGGRSYEVLIEEGLLDCSGEYLRPYARDNRLIAVSDETVWAVQGERLTRGLGRIEPVPILLQPGEDSKSWDVLSSLVDRLLALGVERSDHIVAFGGGVIGDLAGFAASIVKRGCGLIQVPTTLLAQVDSSVGGKTGINACGLKNAVGAFHQPSLVLIDPGCLATLDSRQLRAGYAEVVKYALIEDAVFFEWLEEHGRALLDRDAEALHHAIAVSVAGKARIVATDERETKGKRALHTFGHALEAETGFSDRLLHGEAVAAGLTLAFRFSAERGLCPPEDCERVRTHLEGMGLPVSLRQAGIPSDGAKLVGHMMADKKMSRGRLPFILARGIGAAFIDDGVELSQVEAFLDSQL